MSSYDKLKQIADAGELIVSRDDLNSDWLTQIIQENAQRMKDLPTVIVGNEFSHVRIRAKTYIQICPETHVQAPQPGKQKILPEAS